MSKRTRKARRSELDRFEAYGEYRYDYEPAPQTQEAPPVRRRSSVPMIYRLLIGLVVCMAALIVFKETFFRLNTIYVVGNNARTAEEVVVASGLMRGMNLFSITDEDVARAMEDDHSLVFLKLQKDYPDTLYIHVRERVVCAVLQRTGLLYTLDADGMVMDELDTFELPEGLPMVRGFRVSGVSVGQTLQVQSEKQMEAYRAIMQELTLQMCADQIGEINLSDVTNIYLVTTGGMTVRCGDATYMRAKIGTMRSVVDYWRQFENVSGLLDVTIPEKPIYIPEE